jgi:hypothetical protein
MGYSLQAFICKASDAICLTNKFDSAAATDLGQELSLIPMTEDLFDQINNFQNSPPIDGFIYLTENVEKEILLAIGNKLFTYIEADYYGGHGGQIAMIWQNKKRQNTPTSSQESINQALRYFGVKADAGKDEFLTIGLEQRRHTNDWIDDDPEEFR